MVSCSLRLMMMVDIFSMTFLNDENDQIFVFDINDNSMVPRSDPKVWAGNKFFGVRVRKDPATLECGEDSL